MIFATKRNVDDRTHNISKVVGLALFVAMIFVSVGLFHASTKVPGLPASPSQTVPATFFGMHMHYLVVPSATGVVTPWPDSRVREWRLWDAYTMWPYLEPSKGQWTFQTLDKSVQLAEEHDANLILTLGLTPAWASARPNEPSTYRPGWAAEPKDIEDWRNFVRTVASRYKGRIHVYEVGNEPNLKIFWTGTTEQMIELTREAHDIIKSIDPTALIVSPSATGANGLGWLADFLSKGGGQYVDVIGYHLYVFPKPPEAMVPLAQEVKQVMVKHGVGNKPLWDTESGWLTPTELPSEELQAGYLARAYILTWSQGVERFYWYAWDDHKAVIQLTAANNENRTDPGRAFFVVQDWLLGSRMDWCNEASNHTWTCELNHMGSLRWILWNPDESRKVYVPPSWNIKHTVSLLGTEQALDGAYVEIGPVPILLVQN